MGAAEEPLLRWHEPPASSERVVLLGAAAAALLALATVCAVVDNWDVAVVAGVLGLAAAADLWRDLRPRAFVLAGEDGLVVGRRGRTTVVPWADVVAVRTQPRRLRRDRPVVERADGSLLPLPVEAPVDAIAGRRPPGPDEARRAT